METIIEKLRKIKALAERGVEGEAIAAKFQLEKLLEKHDLTIDDIEDQTPRVRAFKVPNEFEFLFMQLCSSLFGDRRIHYYGRKRTLLYISMTDLEFIDFEQLYDYHKRQYRTERTKSEKMFRYAYITKHDLYSKSNESGESKSSLTLKEIEEIIAIARRMEDNKFRKRLTS